MAKPVDHAFTHALPKAELHAHLSGSISKQTLHTIWLSKQSTGQCIDLEDPITAIRSGDEGFVDIVTFFPLFDKYIYRLVNDIDSVCFATQRVIEEYREDGVAYLELRTTPRAPMGNAETGKTAEDYVRVVNEVVTEVNASDSGIAVFLILSIDRKMNGEQAEEVVDLAVKYRFDQEGDWDDGKTRGYVVGVDLCGNPAKGDVSVLTPAFRRAKEHGLKLTLHFAEIAHPVDSSELVTMLSWRPDRLGHVINVPETVKQSIRSQNLALELCLSCNVLAKLTTGGYAMHHFGEWLGSECPIALSTDDVGVFDSPLSNEYLLAARHFDLSRRELMALSKKATTAAFGDTDRILAELRVFEQKMVLGE